MERPYPACTEESDPHLASSPWLLLAVVPRSSGRHRPCQYFVFTFLRQELSMKH
ncbi:Inositol 2-dehydrogenase [Carbonactinospora thermoautotrophica]|uniref:Inositol 2-dehydrogenase n=1 Tax=Carbonactinospora thermoautotrophica TaxID=1469144 RepID=A0A132MU63_9ACTN|nr:Inositol 2-dehydrogenase [Carbonactinospora thermoautotrophica]